MSKTKIFIGFLIVVAVMFAQTGTALAAPAMQEGTTTTISGTITSIETQLQNGETIILVTLEGYQPIVLSVQGAAETGLYDPAAQELLVQVGDTVELTVDSNLVVPDETVPEETVHPVAALLADFFGEDASVIDGCHEDGYGFGLIAQALWMSQNIGGDAALAGQILEARDSGDYSAFFPEGTENIPTNWGHFKKALSDKKNNLGMIVSGHADNGDSGEPTLEQPQPGNGNGQGNNSNNNNGNNGNGHGNNNHGNGNSHGNNGHSNNGNNGKGNGKGK